MHQPIQEGLEEYLSGNTTSVHYRNVEAHLANCVGCREEMISLREHAELLRALRAPAEVEARPGFYGRVMERIEAQTLTSFWSELLEGLFVRRLVYSSALLLVLLAGYVLTVGESIDTARGSAPEVILASEDETPPDFGMDQERDRAKVLVNLTSYSE